MNVAELTQDLKAKDELIEDLIHDAYDSISLSNESEVRKYNAFLDEVEETCRQMRVGEENIKESKHMEREEQAITYIVNIRLGYHGAIFEFKTIEDASEFISTAALHVVNGDDAVTISMEVKREGEEESDK